MPYRTPLMRRIDKYLKESGFPVTRLGREVAGDPNLVADIRHGRTLGAELERKLTSWLDARQAKAGDTSCSR